MISKQFSILVVDDAKLDREILRGLLVRQGYQVSVAEDGIQALEIIQSQTFDLVFLDILMPRMDGYQLLETIKANPNLEHIPVIMISTMTEIDSITKCIELGAEDYLSKPFRWALLKFRIEKYFERKLLRDKERSFLQKLQEEQEKLEGRLLNTFPKNIVERLKKGQHTIIDHFPDATVMCADFVGSDILSSEIGAHERIEFLTHKFSIFDELAGKYGLEKITTDADSYMVIGGLPDPTETHARAIAEMAIDSIRAVKQAQRKDDEALSVRIGINTGPIRVGVIGTHKVSYDLWGETVRVANQMKLHGVPGAIQVSKSTYHQLNDRYVFEKQSNGILIDGRIQTEAYLLLERRP